MKSKWLHGLLVVLVIWAGVSYYFYTQHKIVVKEYDLNKTVKVGDTRVIFKQICFTNYSSNMQWEYKKDMPWYYDVATRLPAELQIPFAKVCFFYSRPYKVNPDGVLKVKGMIISPKPYEENESPLGISIDIDVYYTDDFIISGRHEEWGSNVGLFSIFGDLVPNTVNKVKAVVTDRGTGETKSLIIRPDWDIKVYHGTWRPEFPFSPEETIRQLVMFLSNKGIDKSRLQPFIFSAAADRFPWQNLQHDYWQQGYKTETTCLENYKGCQDVYSVQLMFLAKGEKIQADKIVASQKIYLVEQKNEWKIIDVSKVENI